CFRIIRPRCMVNDLNSIVLKNPTCQAIFTKIPLNKVYTRRQIAIQPWTQIQNGDFIVRIACQPVGQMAANETASASNKYVCQMQCMTSLKGIIGTLRIVARQSQK